jgi:WD40 repeat protein
LQHCEEVTSVSFSPDGTSLISGAFDEKLTIWEVNSGRHVFSIQELERDDSCQGCVQSIAFHPSGSLVAYVTPNDEVRIRETENWQEWLTIREPLDVSIVAFSPDAKTLALALYDAALCFWDLWGRDVLEYVNFEDRPNAFCFSPDGTTIAVATRDLRVSLVDVASCQIVGSFRGHTAQVTAVCFAFNGQMIATADDHGLIRLWDKDSLQAVSSFQDSTEHVQPMVVTPDGMVVTWGNGEGLIRSWDIPGAIELAPIKGHRLLVRALSYSPDGNWLASGGSDHTVRIWNRRLGIQIF